MKYISKFLLSIFLFCVVPTESHAQNPHSAALVANDLWNKAKTITTTPGGTAYRDTLLWVWNNKSRSSWANIRPQRLELNKNLTGSVRGKSSNKLVSLPILNKNSVTISIYETGGGGKASFTVYTIDKNGRERMVGTKYFNNDKKGEQNQKEKLTFMVNGAKNQIITISIDGDSSSDIFKYRLQSH